MNEHESAAMWKLYAHTDEAVALRSTYQRLFDCLPKQCYVGVVKYIDYDKDWLPEGNTFWPFVHKRKSFEHERELRAVIQEFSSKGQIASSPMPRNSAGRSIEIDVVALVADVYVSPSAPGWFRELVEKITARYGYGLRVTNSNLSKRPVF